MDRDAIVARAAALRPLYLLIEAHVLAAERLYGEAPRFLLFDKVIAASPYEGPRAMTSV